MPAARFGPAALEAPVSRKQGVFAPGLPLLVGILAEHTVDRVLWI